MLALTACAGAADPQAGLPRVEPNDMPGEPLQASWPGLPHPMLSFQDREAIGRLPYAEAGNQREVGLAAVIFTILNRVNWSSSAAAYKMLFNAPYQFECATRARGRRYLPPLDQTQTSVETSST